MKVHLLMDSAHPGAVNMAIDEALGESVIGQDGEIVIRFYGWEPPAVSIGYNQPAADLDLTALSRDGLSWIRRMTGGGGVLHWNEITYSIALPHELGSGRARNDLFVFCADILSALYNSIGIETEAKAPGRYTPIPDCFAATGSFELVEKSTGKKIAGSASAIKRGYFLQHGSLPLDDTHRRIKKYLSADGPGEPDFSGSVSIGQFVSLARAEILERFRFALEEIFDLSSLADPDGLLTSARRRAAEKYAASEWSHRR